jgi:SAM-dependent methyltransferase
VTESDPGPGTEAVVNKTMDRDDLLSSEGLEFVRELNSLAEELDRRRLPVTSWYGALAYPRFELSLPGLRAYARRLLGRTRRVGAQAEVNRGGPLYEPVPGISNDALHPWFLYWEAYWATRRGPEMPEGGRVLDAGGTASLFSCYLASRGVETHSVDLNPRLVGAGEETARAMGWNLTSYCMDMTDMRFEDGYFDYAYSICVFEHLDAELRQRALTEIARVLKPGGILAITFDYGGPGVYLADRGPTCDPANLIRTPDEVRRHFFSCPSLEPWGNHDFFDNGKRYLAWPDDPALRYTFGAVFLQRVD